MFAVHPETICDEDAGEVAGILDRKDVTKDAPFVRLHCDFMLHDLWDILLDISLQICKDFRRRIVREHNLLCSSQSARNPYNTRPYIFIQPMSSFRQGAPTHQHPILGFALLQHSICHPFRSSWGHWPG